MAIGSYVILCKDGSEMEMHPCN